MDSDPLYSRSRSDDPYRRTYVPSSGGGAGIAAARPMPQMPPTTVTLQQRTIVAVLFTRSADAQGEMFPVYAGKNYIGSDEGADIRLKEKTVKGAHALLLVRARDDGHSHQFVIAPLAGGGIEVEGRKPSDDDDAQRIVLEDHDIITIGKHYQLMLYIFDEKGRLATDMAIQRQREAAALEAAARMEPEESMYKRSQPRHDGISRSIDTVL